VRRFHLQPEVGTRGAAAELRGDDALALAGYARASSALAGRGVPMRYRIVGDVSPFSPHANGPASPLWWGMIGMVAIESAVFAILIASYFYLAHGSTGWPQGGIEPPKLLLPTINTVVLVISSLVIHWADT